jgi:hypothetical protein
MESAAHKDLSSLLSPALFHAVLKNRLPWPKEQDIDFALVGPHFWTPTSAVTAEFQYISRPVLKTLSAIPLSSFPDLMQYLPSPSSPSFPEQALGLQLLLDQGGRILKGTDVRWKYDFFDVISLKLARQILALPVAQSPYSKTRWMDELGATFGYWILARMWLQAPLVHSEVLEYHESAKLINEEARIEVEKVTGLQDPNRGNVEILADTLAYPRWTREGPPGGEGTEMQDFAWWELLMMDVHLCIIEKYGGYPQRYAARGREPTERERAYLVETGNFDVIDQEDARQIMEDVKVGKWTPLT